MAGGAAVEGGSEGEFYASGVVVSRRRRGAPVPRRRTGPCDAFCCSGPDPGFLPRTRNGVRVRQQ
jgi:hypothetical protein